MIIRNYKQLIGNSYDERVLNARKAVIDALEKAIISVKPDKLITDYMTYNGNFLRINGDSFDLNKFDNVYVIGAGKASGGMAEFIETIIGDKITAGIINVPEELTRQYKTQKIKLHPATHPLPSEEGMEGTKEMISMVKNSEKTLVLCLISGGGSALMPLPKEEITLEEKVETTEALLNSGADIHELNTVRKHLSEIKGGQLAEKLYPSTVIGLIISDVMGDDLDTIASGPLTPDKTTYAEAYRIIEKYNLVHKLSPGVISLIKNGVAGKISETPKPGNRIFDRIHQYIIGNNKTAIEAAKNYLESRGIKLHLEAELSGDARLTGLSLGEKANLMAGLTEKDGLPRYIIAGGETTVKVTGNGKGGRNQHASAAASLGLKRKGVALAFMGTDGIDGPTDAAGAVVDKSTVLRAGGKAVVLKYLGDDNTYTLFKGLNDLVITGYTGTNVNDIFVAVSF
ncbi:MAG: DUF4147 domain-containing protein [Nitrososphaerota archaeon]|jgi:hydroxypyruvate reductase/glycerate 2-kinase|nr:DUF4147 domain-containing protein [Nitrososphaerota archaeon]MDG6932291.1 DUF4147 domain-containing protein [Nitrososphaerota archaeon]MDG6936467.1 DUF4147 domain-containing protein [Nitrososphaerota archaeon]MDG6944667.1 DUF4147 domain-containing protein [Nitrososphaerota archaeon]